MKHKFSLILCLTNLISVSAAAAENTCISLVRGIGNPFKSLPADEQRAVAKAIMCLRDYTTSTEVEKLQIEVGFDEFTNNNGAADTDVIKTAQANNCEGRFYDYWRLQIKSQKGAGISKDLSESLTGCLALQDPAPRWP